MPGRGCAPTHAATSPDLTRPRGGQSEGARPARRTRAGDDLRVSLIARTGRPVVALLCAALLAACAAPTPTPPSPSVPPPASLTPVAPARLTATPTTPRPTVVVVTPTPDPPRGVPSTGVVTVTYTVLRGDTLSGIAAGFDMSVDDLARLNGIDNPAFIRPGQGLIALEQVSGNGPSVKLLPDSELVNGPAAVGFDLSGFIAAQPGLLRTYTETVDGEAMTADRVLGRVAEQASVNPRLLLTALEYAGGWLSNPDPPRDKRWYPLGNARATITNSLYLQLQWAAARFNEGYYGWRLGTRLQVKLADGSRAFVGDRINAATAGVQNYLALLHPRGAWLNAAGAGGFIETYRRLFGDPWARDAGPPLAGAPPQPALTLPWARGETWYLTGGPHAAWAAGTPWGALDFAAVRTWGCRELDDWVTAMAAGPVVRSGLGDVVQSLDPAADERVGWSVLYLHIGTPDRVPRGRQLGVGDAIGHPSCEGGVALGAHVHVARKYNGEWVNAVGAFPFVLDGWTVFEGDVDYDGGLRLGEQRREACECKEPETNGLTRP